MSTTVGRGLGITSTCNRVNLAYGHSHVIDNCRHSSVLTSIRTRAVVLVNSRIVFHFVNCCAWPPSPQGYTRRLWQVRPTMGGPPHHVLSTKWQHDDATYIFQTWVILSNFLPSITSLGMSSPFPVAHSTISMMKISIYNPNNLHTAHVCHVCEVPRSTPSRSIQGNVGREQDLIV